MTSSQNVLLSFYPWSLCGALFEEQAGAERRNCKQPTSWGRRSAADLTLVRLKRVDYLAGAETSTRCPQQASSVTCNALLILLFSPLVFCSFAANTTKLGRKALLTGAPAMPHETPENRLCAWRGGCPRLLRLANSPKFNCCELGGVFSCCGYRKGE